MLFLRKLFPLSLLPALVALIVVFSCRSGGKDASPTLIVTIEPVRFVVEAIAGENFRVQTLMPRGASPETYEPTPHQMMQLNSCALLFCSGNLGFEQTQLPRMLENTPSLRMVSLSDGIAPLFEPDNPRGLSQSIDPHTWMCTDNLRIMASNACKALCSLDSLHAPDYESRLRQFYTRMDSLDSRLVDELKPVQNRTFLIFHPALGYMARQFGLKQLALEHDGKEPSPARLEELIRLCRAEDVRVAFVSQEHAGQAAHRLAEELTIPVENINPLDYDVPAQLLLIAEILRRNATQSQISPANQ